MTISNDVYIARRILNKFYGGGFISPDAFKENRMKSKDDGHSIDILWKGDVKEKVKIDSIIKCAEICAIEKHDVAFLFSIKSDFLKNPEHVAPIKRILRTKTETNEFHGTLVPRNALHPAFYEDTENPYRVRITSIQLLDIFNKYGEKRDLLGQVTPTPVQGQESENS